MEWPYTWKGTPQIDTQEAQILLCRKTVTNEMVRTRSEWVKTTIPFMICTKLSKPTQIFVLIGAQNPCFLSLQLLSSVFTLGIHLCFFQTFQWLSFFVHICKQGVWITCNGRITAGRVLNHAIKGSGLYHEQRRNLNKIGRSVSKFITLFGIEW